jgi:hypothetical protein
MFGFNFLRTKTEKLKWTKKRLKTSEKLCLESTEAKKLNEAIRQNDLVTSYNLSAIRFNESLYHQNTKAIRQSTQRAIADVRKALPKTIYAKQTELAQAAIQRIRNT